MTSFLSNALGGNPFSTPVGGRIGEYNILDFKRKFVIIKSIINNIWFIYRKMHFPKNCTTILQLLQRNITNEIRGLCMLLHCIAKKINLFT